MTSQIQKVTEDLYSSFFKDHPHEAAVLLAKQETEAAVALLESLSSEVIIPVLESLPYGISSDLLERFSLDTTSKVLEGIKTSAAINFLARQSKKERKRYLSHLPPAYQTELLRLLSYPVNSAGHIMNSRVLSFPDSFTVQDVLAKLKQMPNHVTQNIFIVDEQNTLQGTVSFRALALAEETESIKSIMHPVVATTFDFAPREEALENFEKYNVTEVPIIDIKGVLLGVIFHRTLLQELESHSISSIQSMVGASKDERALSSPSFVVSKRLPWLEINLLTAFLAASVVGLFESLIAQFTALAVLLPVVAGQSGNAGAQALAVTMRALAVREITLKQWFPVLMKEIFVGTINGLVIALTTAVGVYVWSWSMGLALVIFVSMILAMVIAGIAGVLVPMMLTRFGQDPAQSSSIVLTTITDVAGFFSFLGIALLLSKYI